MNQRWSGSLLVGGAIIILLLLLLGATFAGGLILAPYVLNNAQASPVSPPAAAVAQPEAVPAVQGDPLAAYEQALIDLYRQTIPSVVRIEVKTKVDTGLPGLPDLHPFLPSPDDPENPDEFFGFGEGSGFVWDKEGHIVTNYHVVADAETIEVFFADDTAVEATLLGTDPDADLAVIQVDLPADRLTPLPLGDSDALQVGQLAVAIGNPFGQEFTMTSGIVSAVGRTIRSGNTPFSIPEVIQTDAPINPGNSGGPLLNRQGEVIGINAQIISDRTGGSSGIGFAIPVNIAKQVVPTLIKGERYEYAWLGITGRTVTPDVASLMDLPANMHGALVINVAKDGPAEKAGLQGADKVVRQDGIEVEVGGDIITAIDGQPVYGMDDLIAYLMLETRPGQKVELEILRGGKDKMTVTVTLEKRPPAEELSLE